MATRNRSTVNSCLLENGHRHAAGSVSRGPAHTDGEPVAIFQRAVRPAIVAVLLAAAASVGVVADDAFAASRQAVQLDGKIDWSRARLIAVQDAGRYKTLDSFAREAMQAMYGQEHFPRLSPLASALEWTFNRDAYIDTPVIRIRDQGLRVDFTSQMPDDRRERILRTTRMTPREFSDPAVQTRIDELEPKATMTTAIRRVRDAEMIAVAMERMLNIVPAPGQPEDAQWYTTEAVLANVAPELLAQLGVADTARLRAGEKIPGLNSNQAVEILLAWSGLRAGWLAGDAAQVQKHLDNLAELLPRLAGPGVYPSQSQRKAEATYYRMGKFSWGWMLYFAALVVSIWALATGWRVPWVLGICLLVMAMGLHLYGIQLRWFIIGRIPIANMFEAVVGSAWLGVAVGLLFELIYRTRVFLLASCALGFLALIIGGFVLPGGGTITTIMGILDDVMLRIHTVLIIWSYALILLAAVVAGIYLIGYYSWKWRAGSSIYATVAMIGGVQAASSRAGGVDRPLMAGGMPGDDRPGSTLPLWLQQVDWSHLIILNIVFVMLFVGTILGAVWADYSWGRPWGWDPKEVFALNTWLVYAILIHVRFFVQNKGLWTAWLSIAGCLMMAFNWFFVNFFIVGLHSYA